MSPQPSRTISLRSGLILALVAVVFGLGGAVQLTTLLGAQRAVRALSQNLVDNAANRAEVELRSLLGPILQQLSLASDFAEQGLLTPTDTENARRLLGSVLMRNPVLLAAKVADLEGNEIVVLRSDDALALRQTSPRTGDGMSRWIEWSALSDDDSLLHSRREPIEYEVRFQDWYRGALDNLESGLGVFATDPYFVFGTDKLGVTNSLAVRTASGEPVVVAFNILIEEIQQFVEGLEISQNGTVLVLTDEGRIVAIPSRALPPELAIEQWLFQFPQDIDSPLLRAASDAYSEEPGDIGRPRYFDSGGEAWWGHVRLVDVPGDRALIVVVLLPEADLLADLVLIRRRMLLVTFGGLAIALAAAVVVGRRFSRPIEALVRNSDRIRTGDFDGGEPVRSGFAEIGALAEAQERMRAGLSSLVKLEQDLEVARQIQRSTLPKTLPELAGWEFAASNQAADQTGGDTYDAFGLDASWELPAEGEASEQAVFLLADATGHGVGPALSVSQLRGMLRGAIHQGGDLSRVTARLNDQLSADLPANRFITAWLGRVTRGDGTLHWISAGQGPLLHVRRSAGVVEQLKASAPPLGMIAGLPIGLPTPIELEIRDLFVVLSDGYFEAQSPEGEDFGRERMADLLRSGPEGSAAQVLDTIQYAIDRFTENAQPADDRTAVILHRVDDA